MALQLASVVSLAHVGEAGHRADQGPDAGLAEVFDSALG